MFVIWYMCLCAVRDSLRANTERPLLWRKARSIHQQQMRQIQNPQMSFETEEFEMDDSGKWTTLIAIEIYLFYNNYWFIKAKVDLKFADDETSLSEEDVVMEEKLTPPVWSHKPDEADPLSDDRLASWLTTIKGSHTLEEVSMKKRGSLPPTVKSGQGWFITW